MSIKLPLALRGLVDNLLMSTDGYLANGTMTSWLYLFLYFDLVCNFP